jgi:hypothetical protein
MMTRSGLRWRRKACQLCELLELGVGPGGVKFRIYYPRLEVVDHESGRDPPEDRKALPKHRMKCSVDCRKVASGDGYTQSVV